MLTPGTKYRIICPTTGMELVNGTARIVSVPADGIVTLLSGPNNNGRLPGKGLVYTLWEGRTVALFEVDVKARGVEVKQADQLRRPDKDALA